MPALCVSMQGVRHFSFWLATLSPAACHSCCCPSECVCACMCVCEAKLAFCGQHFVEISAELATWCRILQSLCLCNLPDICTIWLSICCVVCLPLSLSFSQYVCERESVLLLKLGNESCPMLMEMKTNQRAERVSKLQQFAMICEILIFMCLHSSSVLVCVCVWVCVRVVT